MKRIYGQQISVSLILLASALVMAVAHTDCARAETYTWVDENGVTHFSDRKPVRNLEKIKTDKKAESTNDDRPITEKKTKLYDLREKVVEILGADAIRLESGKIVKYIGVGDPSNFLKKQGQSSRMEESHKFHENLVKGKIVTVLFGKQKQDKDGRYLGHVFLGQDIFVNAELIRSGYALTEEYPSDFEYQSLFIRLLRDAQRKGAGIW